MEKKVTRLKGHSGSFLEELPVFTQCASTDFVSNRFLTLMKPTKSRFVTSKYDLFPFRDGGGTPRPLEHRLVLILRLKVLLSVLCVDSPSGD